MKMVIFYNQMGNHHHKDYLGVSPSVPKQMVTELSASSGFEDVVWEQIMTVENCCCFKYQTTTRRKVVWESRFLDQLARREPYFRWARHLIDLVNTNQLPRMKYYKEVDYLKKEKPVLIGRTEEQAPSDPDEVERFRKNLKKSVIVSFSNNPDPNSVFKSCLPPNEQRPCRPPGKGHHSCSMSFLQKASRNNSRNSRTSKNSRNSQDRTSPFSGEPSHLEGKDFSKETASELEIFIKFSGIVERHLSDENCILGKIRKSFVRDFCQHYSTCDQSSEVDAMVENVQEFLDLLKQAMMSFYELSSFAEGEGSNMFISNEDNILGTCTAVLFRDHAFYSRIFAIVTNHLRHQETAFERLLNHLKGSGPERFTVKPKFCLNAFTIKNYLRDLCADSGGSINVVENIELGEAVSEQGEPYKGCMLSLHEMAKSRSPVNKLKCIMACSDGITREIERFYDSNGLRREKWMLDPDQVLSLFCYLIVGARVEHLHTHLFLLDNFISSHQQISGSGYYLSVLRCAVEHLQNEFGEGLSSATNSTNQFNGCGNGTLL